MMIRSMLSLAILLIDLATVFASQPSPPINDGEMEDMEFRVAIEPGKEECFYQQAKRAHNLEIAFQVIEMSSKFEWMYAPSSSKDLTIDFKLTDPLGRQILKNDKKQEGSHVHTTEQDGVYSLCFDNTYSSVSSKLVNVEIYLYSTEDDDRWGLMDDDITFPPEIQYQDAIESIKNSINKVRDNLIKVVHSQDERRAIERRDRNFAEQNYDYVNRFSFLSICVMIVVGLAQLYMIRNLFEEKTYLKKVLKSLSS